jgi:hypothetical protein
MPFTQPWFEVDFGAAYGGLGTVGYRLYQADGSDSVARTMTGVVDVSGNGAYGVASVSVPDNAVGIEWDTGGGSPVYAAEDLEPYRDRAELVTDVNAVLVDTDAIDTRLPSDPADQSQVEAAIATSEGNIRGGPDSLDSLSGQVDAVALEANVESHVTSALSTYDPPTRAEATADKDAIITEVNANETKIDALPTATSIADAVWDEPIAGHLGGDKAGQHLDDADATADPGAVADAVWDEATSGHVDAGSFGKLAQDTYADVVTGQQLTNALLHDNGKLDQEVYDDDKNLVSARLRGYDSRANAEAAGATGLRYTFLINSTYTSGLLDSYTLVRVGS